MAAMQQQRSSTSSGLSNGSTAGGTIGVGLNYGGGTRGGGNGGWRHTDLHHPHDYHYAIENNHPTSNIHNPGIPSPTSPSSSHSMLTSVGPIGSSTASYGSVLMERRFRECSISAGGSSSIGNSTSNNIGGWVGVHQNHNTNNYHNQEIPTHHTPHQYPSYTTTSSTLSTYSPAFIEKPSRILPIQLFKEEPDNHNEEEEATPEIETLPLFPMQAGDEDMGIPVVENQTIIPNYFIDHQTRKHQMAI
ncbi:protein WUSCHEL-like [Papaver somniferum]|uniref:protein WUSCHEL-like n=1 Tax=Papaver somniferum TaxID=3469 RepID=UPI000E6F91F8|nr:protein WUSCHEL-like [Papaver somniferum]